jgi:hypothetical protein
MLAVSGNERIDGWCKSIRETIRYHFGAVLATCSQ